ncbi:MAG: VirB3 family type IV secretion system protein [Gammaproteobacteria bacterium]
MSDTSIDIVLDPLFIGATRPPMRCGTTYAALVLNMVCTMEIFLMSKNLLTLLIAVPIHGLCALLCSRDPKIFDLLAAWCRTRLPALVSTHSFWAASSYSPLELDLPTIRGRRRAPPFVRI